MQRISRLILGFWSVTLVSLCLGCGNGADTASDGGAKDFPSGGDPTMQETEEPGAVPDGEAQTTE